MNMHRLWQERCRMFWKSAAPYFRYVLGGGLGVMLLLFFMIGGYFYAQLLQSVDERFPAAIVGVVLLWIPLTRLPVRTFLREPDPVFLMRAESRMTAYVRAAKRYSLLVRALPPLVIWTLYWPLFQAATGHAGHVYLLVVSVMILTLVFGLSGQWTEQQLLSPRTRSGFILLRIVLTASVLAVTMHVAKWQVLWVVVPAWLAYRLALTLPAQMAFHWERLIELEKRHQHLVYLFLSGFVDVEELPRKVRRRTYLEPLVRWIPHNRSSSWTYLYSLTWIRTEMYALVVRLSVIGLIIIVFAADAWLKAVACWIALYLSALQLTSLAQVHRHDIWVHLYPLPETGRISAVHRLSRTILGILAIIMLVPLAILSSSWLWAVLGACGALLVISIEIS